MDLVEVDPRAAGGQIQVELGWNRDNRHQVRSQVYQHVDAPRGSAPRGIAWSDVDAKYRALMPDSKLPARRIEESLTVIHGFDKVNACRRADTSADPKELNGHYRLAAAGHSRASVFRGGHLS